MTKNPRLAKAWRILCYARPYWRQLALILLLMLLSTALSLPQPIVLKYLIDGVLLNQDMTMLNLLLAGLLGLYILQNMVGFSQKYLTTIIGQRLLIDIRQEIVVRDSTHPGVCHGNRREPALSSPVAPTVPG